MVNLRKVGTSSVLLCLCCLLLACSGPDIEQTASASAQTDHLIEIGRAIYRDGLGADGNPIRARVAGDVEILATQFSCNSCHGISGLGSMEASYIVPIIAGPILFNPAVQPQRPAYDGDSLANLLRNGITPAGREVDSLMPRFILSDEEANGLRAYLESLSVGPSPGADGHSIRLATVVTSQTPVDLRDAVLSVLQKFVEEKNRQTRKEGDRWDRGTTPESQLPTVYRDWTLEVWELQGSPSSWAQQLQKFQEDNPVFALLGGLIVGGGDPLGEFCERNRLPCILPSVAFPQVPEDGLYSLYFSRGLALEAELIATHAKGQGIDSLIQISCNHPGSLAAKHLQENYVGRSYLETFDCAEGLPVDRIIAASHQHPDAALVFWLDRPHLTEAKRLQGEFAGVYYSSTFLDAKPGQLAFVTAPKSFLVHPYVLPDRTDPAFVRFLAWTKTRDIQITHPLRQSEAFFAAMVMKDGVKHLDRYLVRDYLVDLIGHMQGISLFVPFHARPTFGPRQAFLTKGGYVLPVRNGNPVVASPEWVIP